MFNLFKPLIIFVLLPLFCLPVHTVFGQSRNVGHLTLKVSINESDQDYFLVQNLALIIQKLGDDPSSVVSSIRTSTTTAGTASMALVPGDYVVKSERALVLDDKAYDWSVPIKVEPGKQAVLDLTATNATIKDAFAALKEGRITEEADLLNVLRRGIVSVQGELVHGSGIIVDRGGLILTNEHTIRNSKELRIQIETQKLEARLLHVDSENGLAVLRANLDPCSQCRALNLASESSPLEGERVFLISSRLSKADISSGLVLRADSKTITPDFSASNEGGALFNMSGEVVGISGLMVKEAQELQRTIRIEEARKLLESSAPLIVDPALSPSTDLLPVEPEFASLPNTLTLRDIKRFSTKPYMIDVGKYQVTMMTPVLKHFIIEKDRYEHERQEVKLKLGPAEKRPHRAVSSFYNLRSWAEYVSHFRPVVHMLAIPEVKATGKSLFFSLLGASMGVFSPLDFKFKADFEEMGLMCDGKLVPPIQRGKIEYVEELQNYYRFKRHTAYAGIYTYSAETFEPGKCNQLELQVYSESNLQSPDRKLIGSASIQQVWRDFEGYRTTLIQR